MMSRERKTERKFSKGSSSPGKRTRESQVELVHSSATRGRRQGPTKTLGSFRGNSTEQGERIECPHCQKCHYGTCRLITRGCFRCGSTYHLMVNCPRGFGILSRQSPYVASSSVHPLRCPVATQFLCHDIRSSSLDHTLLRNRPRSRHRVKGTLS